MLLHCVYFWLREDLGAAERAAFDAGVRSLTTIETVAQSFVGAPAETDRPVIDRSYACALVVAFADRAAHDAYQDHPVHERFRDQCSSFWTRVQIYDVAVADAAGAPPR